MKQYLVLFFHRDQRSYVDFRLEEFQSLCELYGFNQPFTDFETVKKETIHSPIVWAQLPSEEMIHQICSRSMLIKAVYEILAHDEKLSNVVQQMQSFPIQQQLSPFIDKPLRIRSVWYGKKCPHQAQLADVKRFEFFLTQMSGEISLNAAQVEYHCIQNFGDYSHLGWAKSKDDPEHVYFGRLIANGNRSLIYDYTLKKRTYIGPTSMDSELAFLMANQGNVKRGDVIFDPFVGTGSLLVHCAHFGAITVGTDIDMRILKGESKEKNIYANFRQYKLPYPELLRSDLSSCVWSDTLSIDAIICDPPYGVRAGGRKSGVAGEFKAIPEEFWDDHMPRTQQYEAEEVMSDLLTFAARFLTIGGRLVYLLPATTQFTDKDLPLHPALTVVGNSEQQCQGILRRRLITMIKNKPFESDMKPYVPSAPDFANLREKIFVNAVKRADKLSNANENDTKPPPKKKQRIDPPSNNNGRSDQ